MISITIVTICNEISIPSIFENIKLPQNELNSMLLLLITFFAIPPIPQNKSYLIVLYLYKICTGYVWDVYGNGKGKREKEKGKRKMGKGKREIGMLIISFLNF